MSTPKYFTFLTTQNSLFKVLIDLGRFLSLEELMMTDFVAFRVMLYSFHNSYLELSQLWMASLSWNSSTMSSAYSNARFFQQASFMFSIFIATFHLFLMSRQFYIAFVTYLSFISMSSMYILKKSGANADPWVSP